MFRLLDNGDRSGTLHISSRSAEALVCFRDGKIFYATAAASRETIGEKLIHANVISEKQLRQAQGLMKIQKRDKAGRRLGQILVDEGYLDADLLENFVSDQITDALFELLRWDDGELRFEPEEDRAEMDLGLYVPVDKAVSDAEKRLEAWGRIRDKIPTPGTRFVMSTGPGQKPMDIHLKPREWMLLCHLHGPRSVSELVELTGYNDFETARTLYGMVSGGLIEQVGSAAGESSAG